MSGSDGRNGRFLFGCLLLPEPLRRHLQGCVDAPRIVVVYLAMNSFGKFTERLVAFRVLQFKFKVCIEGLLVAVFPRRGFLGVGGSGSQCF